MTNEIDHSELVLLTNCWMAHLFLLSPFSERDVRRLLTHFRECCRYHAERSRGLLGNSDGAGPARLSSGHDQTASLECVGKGAYGGASREVEIGAMGETAQ